MKEIYLHKNDMPKSCVDCDFRQDTYCKAQRIDDGEYVSCNQSKKDMINGKPITCPLKCIESGELCEREEVRKETAREILLLLGKGFDETARKDFKDLQWYKQFCRELKFRYGIEQVENFDKLEDEE